MVLKRKRCTTTENEENAATARKESFKDPCNILGDHDSSKKWDYPVDFRRCMARIQLCKGRVAVQCNNLRNSSKDYCKKHAGGQLYYGRIDQCPPEDKILELERLQREVRNRQFALVKRGKRRIGLKFFALPMYSRDDPVVWFKERDINQGVTVSTDHCRVGDFVCIHPNTSKAVHNGVDNLIAKILGFSASKQSKAKNKSTGDMEVLWYVDPRENIVFRDMLDLIGLEKKEIIETINRDIIPVECIKKKVIVLSADEFDIQDGNADFFCHRRFDPITYDFDEVDHVADMDDVEVGEEDRLVGAKAVLELNYTLKHFVGREKHMAMVTEFLDKFLEDGPVDTNTMFVYGVPGTGKTAVVTAALSVRGIRYIIANGMNVESPRHIWQEILNHLTDTRESMSTKVAEKKLHEWLGAATERLVIVIDEIDALTSNMKVLYQLFDLAALHLNLAIIAISNTMDIPLRLSARTVSRVRLVNVAFMPYNKDEVKAILKDRLKNHPEIFADKALDVVSIRLGNSLGDIRRALAVCTTAVDIFIENNRSPPIQAIDMEHAEEKRREPENFALRGIDSLFPVTRLVLIALVQDLAARKADMSTMQYLRNQFTPLMNKHTIPGMSPELKASINPDEWCEMISSSVRLLIELGLLESLESGPRRARIAAAITGKIAFSQDRTGCARDPDAMAILALKFGSDEVIDYLKNKLQDPVAREIFAAPRK
eukprot:GEMP01016012.1.p1 GENE.GEMP01016012.1~~GEMP01016012.1.p1  ORF type:complete len:759 (+),score=119.87 GEMP01016012.1:137-2278(+)